jgi:F420-dependent oxidoreductase-like protein
LALVFGFHVPRFTVDERGEGAVFSRAAELAVEAERVGFDLLTLQDHFVQIPSVGDLNDPMLEAYSTLSGLSQLTSRMMLGTLVTGVTYRNPALLAKTVTTLDVISGGRAILGIGAAWNEDEHRRYGFDYPPIAERMDRLEEALMISRTMFQSPEATFEGQHYRVSRAPNVPRPIQRGGPAILVGGVGEQRTLRLAAQYADFTHWFALGLDVLKHKIEVLARHCEAAGRDPRSIRMLTTTPVLLVADRRSAERLLAGLKPPRRESVIAATVDEAADRLATYIDAGFSGFTFDNPVLDSTDAVGLAGELIAKLDPPRARRVDTDALAHRPARIRLDA